MGAGRGVERRDRPEVQMADLVAVQRVARHLGNDVVGDCRRHRGDPQTEDVVSVPPGHVGLSETGNREEIRHRADEVAQQDKEQGGAKEPQGDVQSLGLAHDHGHPDVDRQRRKHEEEYVSVDRPDQILILAAGGHAVDQREEHRDHADVPRPAVPHAELLAPQLGLAQSRRHVAHSAGKGHGDPTEDDEVHVHWADAPEVQPGDVVRQDVGPSEPQRRPQRHQHTDVQHHDGREEEMLCRRAFGQIVASQEVLVHSDVHSVYMIACPTCPGAPSI